jgi:nucleotide sugar dehydrogenase
MIIGVIGGKEVGLSFALLCEKIGYNVIFSDSEEDYIYNLNNKICITNEPMVQSMLLSSVNFSATTDNLELMKNSDMIFTFIPTPQSIEGNLDTKNVFDVMSNFYSLSSLDVPLYNKKFIVCSTTNPGDVGQIQTRLYPYNVQVAYVSEFTSKGDIVKGFQQSDVLLIGTEYQEFANELIGLYTKVQTTPVNAYVMSIKAAEITKIGINSLIATKITYANMLGETMINSGIEDEINMVLTAVCGDSKIDKKYLKYGVGFGGPSIPKDNRVFGNYLNSVRVDVNLPLTIDDYNKKHSEFLKHYYIQKNPDKTIPFVMNGISHKKGFDVVEESQQFQLCIDLLDEGYTLYVIEINEITKKLTSLSDSYSNRLKFFKPNTNPQGYKINLL